MLVGLLLCQVLQPSIALGYSLISIYVVVLFAFKPMKPLYHSIVKPDINIPVERQASNKAYSFTLLLIKILLLVSCIGLAISGAVLYNIFFLKNLAIKLHYLFVYWAFVFAAFQLGVNIGISVLPKINEHIQTVIQYAAYFGCFGGFIAFFHLHLASFLLCLHDEILIFHGIEGFILLGGFVSLGMMISRVNLKLLSAKV